MKDNAKKLILVAAGAAISYSLMGPLGLIVMGTVMLVAAR